VVRLHQVTGSAQAASKGERDRDQFSSTLTEDSFECRLFFWLGGGVLESVPLKWLSWSRPQGVYIDSPEGCKPLRIRPVFDGICVQGGRMQ
jgi:hypothetical protein